MLGRRNSRLALELSKERASYAPVKKGLDITVHVIPVFPISVLLLQLKRSGSSDRYFWSSQSALQWVENLRECRSTLLILRDEQLATGN